MPAFAFASLAALAYGVSDFYGGVVTRRSDAIRVVVWSQVVGLALLLIVVWRFGGGVGPSDIGWAILAGLAGAVGLVSLYRGLSTGRAVVVAPLSGVLSGVVPAIVGFGLGERPSPVTVVGFIVAAAAVWLVSGGRTVRAPGFALGALAGVGFGLFFVLLSPIPDTAGLWPLVPARASSIGVLVLLQARRGLFGSPGRVSTWGLIALVGVGDTLANVFILLALQQGPLGEGAVVSSLYPAVTVLLSAILLREPVRRMQWTGLAMAIGAMALIAG